MLRPGPSIMALMSSALAPAALSRLQTLEKYLENGNSASSVEVVQCLEDTVADIKKLEEIRRQTLECLEEETIKNSNLRFRLQKIPGELIAEMRALVAAAREASAARIIQLQNALRNITDETELLVGKKTLCERQNAALCEEKEHLWIQQKEKEELLNERMARKVNTNVLLTETCDKTREIELEIIRARAALEELKEKIAQKMSKLEKEEEEWDEKTREMKKILDAQMAKNSEKKHEFENLNKKYLDIQHLINLNSTAISKEEMLIAELKEKSKVLEETLESKSTGTLAVTEEKTEPVFELLLSQSEVVQEKEDFTKELGKAEEDLHAAECLNKNLKLENKDLQQKYVEVLEEEEQWARNRNKVLAKRKDFSVLLDAKIQAKEKALKVKENLEKEIEKLEERLENMRKAYEEALIALEQDLMAQKKTRVMLLWKLLYSAQQRKSFLSEVENINRKVNERIEADKQKHADLLLKIEDLKKEIIESENQIRALTEEATKKKNEYRKYNEGFTNQLKHLESDIKTAMEILLKKEEELNTSRLTLEEIQRETEEKHTKYEELRKSYLEKKNEELKVKRDIQQSVNTTEKLKEDMLELRKELQLKRDAEVGQLRTHTESLKLLERDIYEINRKLDIVNIENFRLKLCNVQIKQDIFAINSEAENHKSAIVRLRNDGAVLHDLLLRGWSEESLMQKEILENKQEMLTAVIAVKTNIQQQEEKIGGICSRLQNELQGLDALFAKKSRLDDRCFAEG